MNKKILVIFIFCFFTLNKSNALIEVDITRGNLDPLPIAVSPLHVDVKSQEYKDLKVKELGDNISSIIEKNFKNTGLFNPLKKESFVQNPDIAHVKPRFEDWRLIKAQALVTGKVTVEENKLRAEFRLWDVLAGKEIMALAFTTVPNNWRRVGHIITDKVYERLTGEKGYFDIEDTARILAAGKKYGLIPKVHVNQFNAFGGIAVSVAHQALSVDHLEELTQEDIHALKGANTMPVALPACSFFLSIPYTPARRIIDAGLPLALASDYNPGSAPTGNMNLVMATACIKMKMTPEEAINAATINGAFAMKLSHKVGSITKGKLANFFITKTIASYHFLPYHFGDNLIETVYLKGKKMSL